MKIVTTCRVKRTIKASLAEKFPSVSLQYCADIEEAEKYLPEAEVLITYGEDLTDEHIEMATSLKWIMVISAGMDLMPFRKIEEKNILVTNVKGIHASPMAEYAISMLLQVSRNAKTLMENQKAHVWDRKVPMTEISEKTMMVIGSGAIGQEVARLAKAFRMKTIGISRSGRAVDYFDETATIQALMDRIGEADFVVSVLPSTKETENLLQETHFNNMKESAIFLNMGRGITVDEPGMIRALQNEKFAHAVLDVFHQEPLPEDNPLWDMENVTITPHLSGISPQYQPRAFEIFEENLTKYIQGEKPLRNEVDPKRGY
ncbi:phosphoglycerate dehydrogenase-like enzyme [Salirhabdus euzebyi]|uniref:Phosphoglycerate dehydrogenase-like enzyme n=1 Tax=Salirhabdus euzebyi TaxID=394506 RepID=A0A841Q9M7_9BACI|nr:D-2-hydroxyacid dehydrogenase [Salirhabdus euzebyi]MBB6455128.1 phosphoglycerate dehydrogenase-like enzyme [Salirhabdus euzebyi]